MPYHLYRCDGCGTVVAQYTRPDECPACGHDGAFETGSAFETVDARDVHSFEDDV